MASKLIWFQTNVIQLSAQDNEDTEGKGDTKMGKFFSRYHSHLDITNNFNTYQM